MTTAAAEPRPPKPRLFEPSEHGWAAVRLGGLMVLAAVTEGIGLILLVPLLAMAANRSDNWIAARFADFGIPAQLDVILGLFVALIAARAIIIYYRGLAAIRFEHMLIDRLRLRGWNGLLHCDWRALLGMRQTVNASVLMTQVDQVGVFINQVLLALATAVMLGGIGLAALAISPPITVGAGVAGALVLLTFRRWQSRASTLGTAMARIFGQIYGQVSEGLGALRIIKSLGSEDAAAASFAAQFRDLRRVQLDYQRDRGQGQALLQISGSVMLALLVWVAVAVWQTDIAIVLPMVALFARALPLLGVLQQTSHALAHARPAVDATLNLIARTEAACEPPADPAAAPVLQQAIMLDDVSVRFGDGPPALDRVSCSIPACGVTALTGPSGAGKSTLADLLGGLLSPDSGTVTVDGAVLAGAARRAWRGKVAYVQQDPVLVSASIRDNLRWAAPEADDQRLKQALRDASAGYVLDLPDGLDTQVGDGGRTLSGGERQRLMLARALLRDPVLLILDEATSALDSANEAHVSAAIERLRGRMAVVIIGHRGTLLDLADHEIRLENGRIVAPLSQ